MTSSARELLENWTDLWALPELWVRRYKHDTELLPADMVRHLCAGRLLESAPLESALELVRIGEFAAADALADELAIEGLITPEQKEHFELKLRERRSVVSRRFEAQLFELRARIQQLGATGRGADSLRAATEQARRSASDRLPEAHAALEQLERRLTEYEAAEAAKLSDQLDQRLAADGERVRTEWLHSTRSAIETGDFSTARFLLEYADEWDPGVSRAPWRDPWPYTDDIEAMVSWFRGEGPRGTGAFQRLWGIRPDDQQGWELLAALEALMTRPGRNSRADAGTFLDALERALGGGASSQVIRFQQGVFWRRIAGLRAPGLYAFNGEEYDGGVVVAVAFEHESDQREIRNGDLEEDEYDPVLEAGSGEDFGAEAGVVDGSELYVYFGTRPPDWHAATSVQLSPELVLRHLGDVHRAQNLRRQITIRLPLAMAYPGPLPRNDGGFVLGRDAEQQALLDPAAPVLWLGPPGSGRTTLLRSATRAARDRGWAVVELPLDFGPGGGLEALVTAARAQVGAEMAHGAVHGAEDIRAWVVASGQQGLLVTIDGIDRLPGEAGMETVQLLNTLQRQREPLIRALATALPTFHSDARPITPSRFLSPYLRPDAARKLLESVIDFLGISFETFGVVDRMVYYSGGHLGLLHQLLWALVAVLGEREPGTFLVARSADVDRAARSSSFRSELDRTLELLHPRPELRIVLGALMLEEQVRGPNSEIKLEALHDWIQGSVPGLGISEFHKAGTQLETLGLAIDSREGWRMPPGGIPHLIAELTGNVEDFIDQAVDDWNAQFAIPESADARPSE